MRKLVGHRRDRTLRLFLSITIAKLDAKLNTIWEVLTRANLIGHSMGLSAGVVIEEGVLV